MNYKDHQDQNDESGGNSGQSGQIEFAEFLGTGGPSRDDLLSPQEIKRLQSQHEALHKDYVKKQKELRSERQAAKDNKSAHRATHTPGQGLSGGSGEMSLYKPNPILDCAQFSGATDKKVNPSAANNEANTNEEQRADIELQYKLQNQPRYTPKPGFNPRPTPR